MKVKSTILLELNKSETELLNGLYTRTALKILAPELSLQEINELIDDLTKSNTSI
ncbi:hypothetical protein LGL55_02145 [Clostridium tagluense]|uniref:hypothetical protein n=1 Tax=Clostridium TaxID=1485 RepID=UPI0013E94FA0|nr:MULTISPECIES: hypothetical protein [Clostridium]MBU3126550.1 hypothetical protein [Clostridium tagluense]MBW9156330.1 hypothetical protein [Clostridium tagluense]MBZ9624443.1 hypothetical protein [Clostridium sp. FP2]MCB2297030.1 hypothetical protein [Clostridium tagluense]MCB2309918.1 hypothetical protein [Clostridium tagluense]